MRHWVWGKGTCTFPPVLFPLPGPSHPSHPTRHLLPPSHQHLGLVGLLQLQLVEPHLLVMLASQLLQCLCHPEVVLLLLAAVHLHQVPLMLPACLPHLLGTEHADPLRRVAGSWAGD